MCHCAESGFSPQSREVCWIRNWGRIMHCFIYILRIRNCSMKSIFLDIVLRDICRKWSCDNKHREYWNTWLFLIALFFFCVSLFWLLLCCIMQPSENEHFDFECRHLEKSLWGGGHGWKITSGCRWSLCLGQRWFCEAGHCAIHRCRLKLDHAEKKRYVNVSQRSHHLLWA